MKLIVILPRRHLAVWQTRCRAQTTGAIVGTDKGRGEQPAGRDYLSGSDVTLAGEKVA